MDLQVQQYRSKATNKPHSGTTIPLQGPLRTSHMYKRTTRRSLTDLPQVQPYNSKVTNWYNCTTFRKLMAHLQPLLDLSQVQSYHSQVTNEPLTGIHCTTPRPLRAYQFNFMLLGPDRPKIWQMSFNNDSLRRLVSALVWEGLNHLRIRYHTADELVHC